MRQAGIYVVSLELQLQTAETAVVISWYAGFILLSYDLFYDTSLRTQIQLLKQSYLYIKVCTELRPLVFHYIPAYTCVSRVNFKLTGQTWTVRGLENLTDFVFVSSRSTALELG